MRCAQFRLTLLLLLTLSTVLRAQENSGLLFRSYESPIASRTSLHLSPNEPLAFEQALEVNFEVSLWRTSELGYLLRFSSPDLSSRIDLLYKPGEDGENLGVFKLSINGLEQGLELKIPSEKLVRNRWMKIQVTLDKVNGELGLAIDEQRDSIKSSELRLITAFNPVFGRSPYTLPSSVATPRFGIKNLKLTIDKQEHFWTLQKEEGSQLSSENRHTIEVQDPEWIIDGHQRWQSQYTQQTRPLPGIAFDPTKGEVYIVGEELITIYDLASRAKTEFTPQNSFPKDQGTQAALYSTKQQQLYGYNLGPEKGYAFNKNTERWENEPTGDEPPIYIWQHAPFENTLNGHPMIFAGYGFFTARNSLLQLDTATQEWMEIPLKGDLPAPRFMLGITEAYQPGEYYVYGGYGNESGDQELGYQNLNDLYLLNLNDSSITKVWEKPPGSTVYLPSTSMVLHQEDSSIYAIGYDYLEGTQVLELLKININSPEVEVIPLGEKLPFEIKNIGDYNLFLYYAAQTKELVSVLRINTDANSSEVRIHTISYPPSAAKEKAVAATEIPWEKLVIILLGGLSLVLWAVRRKPKSEKPEKNHLAVQSSSQQFSIRVLGDFKLTEPTGVAITQKLSPKLKELFLLILLHTLSEQKGISSQKLTEVLWPDASAASAKNNRGVNLQKLRQVLGAIPAVAVLFEENKWRLTFENIDDCDLHSALQSIAQNELAPVISLAQSGTLLSGTNYDWLDAFKVELHFKIIQFLTSKAANAKTAQDWPLLVSISRAVLAIDPVHDDALRELVHGLTSLKKIGNAQSAYEQFAERYQQLYNEAYPISFDELLD